MFDDGVVPPFRFGEVIATDNDLLDFVELMDAIKASGVFAVSPSLTTEA